MACRLLTSADSLGQAPDKFAPPFPPPFPISYLSPLIPPSHCLVRFLPPPYIRSQLNLTTCYLSFKFLIASLWHRGRHASSTSRSPTCATRPVKLRNTQRTVKVEGKKEDFSEKNQRVEQPAATMAGTQRYLRYIIFALAVCSMHKIPLLPS